LVQFKIKQAQQKFKVVAPNPRMRGFWASRGSPSTHPVLYMIRECFRIRHQKNLEFYAGK